MEILSFLMTGHTNDFVKFNNVMKYGPCLIFNHTYKTLLEDIHSMIYIIYCYKMIHCCLKGTTFFGLIIAGPLSSSATLGSWSRHR